MELAKKPWRANGAIKLIAISLATLLLCTACSGVKFFYNRLDWLIPWYLDDYISLTDLQEEDFKQRLLTQLRWHRSTQLTAYADWLQQLSSDLQDGLTQPELDQHYTILQRHWRTLVGQLAPETAKLLRIISDQQLAELYVGIEEKNLEYRQQYVALPEHRLRQKQASHLQERLEDWLGALKPEQVKAVADWSQRYRPLGEAGLNYRRQWQGKLKALLVERNRNVQFVEDFVTAVANVEQGRAPAYQQKLDFNGKIFMQLLLAIDRLMSSRQRQHLTDRLQDLAQDLAELAEAAD